MELVNAGLAKSRGAFAEMNPGTPANMEGSLMWSMSTAIRSHEAVVHLLATPPCRRLGYMRRAPNIELDPSLLPPTCGSCISVGFV